MCTERRCAERPLALHSRGPLVDSNGPHGCKLVPLFANLLSGTLLRQSLLHPASLARLQVVGVTFHFLNDVLGLDLALEAAQGVFQRLTLLQSNFCHSHHPQTSHDMDKLKFTPFRTDLPPAAFPVLPGTPVERTEPGIRYGSFDLVLLAFAEVTVEGYSPPTLPPAAR
jgi:hypothetical protein